MNEPLIRTRFLLVTDLGEHELLLVNTLSGALHRVPAELRQVLTSEERRIVPDCLSDELRRVVSRLTRWGYFFRSEDDEQARLETLQRRVEEIRRRRPSLHNLALTHSCFFHCVYCFEGDTTSHATFLSPEDIPPFFDALARIEQRIDARVPPYIALYGGEPLQPRTFGIVEELLRAGAERGIGFSAVTNGFFLGSFVGLFAAQGAAFRGVQVVLDGPPAVHDRRRMLKQGGGTFERIADAVTRSLDAGLSVRVRVNLDRDNLASLPELSETLRARGWTAYDNFHAAVAPVEDHLCHRLPHVFAEDELIAAYLTLENDRREALSLFECEKVLGSTWYLESRVQRRPDVVLPKFAYCDAHSGKGMCFGADGAIYPCYKALEDEQAQVGRFLPSFTLDEGRLRLWLGRTVTEMPRCSDCAAATLCGGGCAYAQLKHGLAFEDGRCPPVSASLAEYARLRRDLITRSVPSAGPAECAQ